MQGFLKCDAVGCDHRENHDGLHEGLVGKPCPKCGADLLTREDFDQWMQVIAPAAEMMRALGMITDDDTDPRAVALVSVHLHAGELRIASH